MEKLHRELVQNRSIRGRSPFQSVVSEDQDNQVVPTFLQAAKLRLLSRCSPKLWAFAADLANGMDPKEIQTFVNL
jgi:hypothetical protein